MTHRPTTHRTVAVVSAGLREPSTTRLLADRLAEATRRQLELDGASVTVEVVELRTLAHELTDHLLTGFPGTALRAAIDLVTGADALIAVTPIFSASYSGLFKTFFDVLEPGALDAKPVLVAATGGSARHSLALEHAMRPLFSYLHAVVVPTAVYAASEDWGSVDAGALTTRVERAGGELARLVAGMQAVAKPDPYAEPTPFAQLLGRV